jgi:hypothetical protein
MRLTRPIGLAAAAVLVLTSCASTTDSSRETADAEDSASSGSLDPGKGANEGQAEDEGGGGESGKEASRGAAKDGSGNGGSGQEGGSTGAGDSGGPAPGRPGNGGRSGGVDNGSGPTGAGGEAWPSAGTYIYAQKGFEEFCAPQCERYKLPPKQRIDTSYSSRSETSVVVVTKARASGDRLVRTTTRHTDTAAHVLEVHLEYSYEGFDFSRTYRPSPPVASLRFPFRTGRSWSGRWDGDVSGSYSVEVTGHEDFAGSDVARLDTSTRFRGDFEGSANVTLWVDPGDGTVMKTAGNMTVEMGFGTYRTGFATTLRTRP